MTARLSSSLAHQLHSGITIVAQSGGALVQDQYSESTPARRLQRHQITRCEYRPVLPDLQCQVTRIPLDRNGRLDLFEDRATWEGYL